MKMELDEGRAGQKEHRHRHELQLLLFNIPIFSHRMPVVWSRSPGLYSDLPIQYSCLIPCTQLARYRGIFLRHIDLFCLFEDDCMPPMALSVYCGLHFLI
jgi:hypothetical protein